jgi:hypothetical protein
MPRLRMKRGVYNPRQPDGRSIATNPSKAKGDPDLEVHEAIAGAGIPFLLWG